MLSEQLVQGFMEHCRGRSNGSHKVQVSSMALFFRFLDDHEDRAGKSTESLEDLGDWAPAFFLSYLRDSKYSAQSIRKHYHNVFRIVNFSLQAIDERTLFWALLESPSAPRLHRNVSDEGVRLLKLACREYLKSIDRDPKINILPSITPYSRPDTYKKRESVLCIESQFIERNARRRWQLLSEGLEIGPRRRSAFASPTKALRRKLYGSGPEDEGPPFYWQMLYQDSMEAYAALTIVAIDTGWIDSLIWIDVNSEWRSPSLGGETSQEKMLLISRRGKTGSFVVSSQQNNQGSAPWAIRRAINRTSKLRNLISQERIAIGDPNSIDKRMRLQELDHFFACPFIYYGHSGLSMAQPNGWSSNFKLFIASWANHIRPGADEKIMALNFSDLRDAFARKILEKSNGNIFAVQDKLGHTCISSTMRYLNQADHVEEMFRTFVLVTGVALHEVQNGYGVDPKNLMARCFNGVAEELSDSVRNKLSGLRTASGARCQNPLNPPPYIDPLHQEGEFCSTQRCVLCSEGMFFPSERGVVEALIKRAWELSDLRKVTAVQKWFGTDACYELEAILMLAQKFYEDKNKEFPPTSY